MGPLCGKQVLCCFVVLAFHERWDMCMCMLICTWCGSCVPGGVGGTGWGGMVGRSQICWYVIYRLTQILFMCYWFAAKVFIMCWEFLWMNPNKPKIDLFFLWYVHHGIRFLHLTSAAKYFASKLLMRYKICVFISYHLILSHTQAEVWGFDITKTS